MNATVPRSVQRTVTTWLREGVQRLVLTERQHQVNRRLHLLLAQRRQARRKVLPS